jgi:D-alanine-D-alanine ligase
MPYSVTLHKHQPYEITQLPKGQLVIKPNAAGSSDGLSIISDVKGDEFSDAVKNAFEYDSTVLVEQYIQGTEITVGVIGNEQAEALPIVEIIPNAGVFDRKSKYTPGETQKFCPARLSIDVTSEAQRLALLCHKALGCKGMSRTDMIVSSEPNNNIYVLETNTIPGLTPTSLLPLAAKQAGLTYTLLLDKLIGYALENKTR